MIKVIRLLMVMVDIILSSIVSYASFILAYLMHVIITNNPYDVNKMIIAGVPLFLNLVVFFPLVTYLLQGTIGTRLFGYRLVDVKSSSRIGFPNIWKRTILSVLFVPLLPISIITIWRTTDHQSLSDMVVGFKISKKQK